MCLFMYVSIYACLCMYAMYDYYTDLPLSLFLSLSLSIYLYIYILPLYLSIYIARSRSLSLSVCMRVCKKIKLKKRLACHTNRTSVVDLYHCI